MYAFDAYVVAEIPYGVAPNTHRLYDIEFFMGRPRRGDNFTSLVKVLQTLYSKRQKHLFLPGH